MTATVRIDAPSHSRVLVKNQDRIAVFGGTDALEWVNRDSITIEKGESATVHVWIDRRVIVEEID